jgi:hypothetical protein
MPKKLTQEEFIERSRMKHGDKYDYSMVKYENNTTPVKIICRKHGVFSQRPVYHLQGCDCPLCANEENGIRCKSTTSNFITESIKIHGNKYDYSKVDYKDNSTKVCIICPEHGEFWQRPNNHLSGQGCPACGGTKKLTTEEFIKKSIEIHGKRYDYSKVTYVNSDAPVLISCEKHGDFLQTPHAHLAGQGCPSCLQSKLEESVSLCLNNYGIEYERQKTYKWLKNKKNLRLDFYIPSYNIAIECQGLQHYSPVKQWGGDGGLLIIQERDRIKRKLCTEHNIKIYYIKYNDCLDNKIKLILEHAASQKRNNV